ncbi:hypothetical protein [Sphingomonas sp. SCN 67-18]|uniref:hypothetical protein n=1 Tax=uncultured Sphingomonas sp. TaxID=158754 RepID=UPI0025DE1DD0|nr:hypothetical protein [Sphingomonas sp. SCN 67-18]
MLENGSLIRLFPVPFRLIRDGQQFKKWQWISAQIYRANDDRRPESHKIYVDTIQLEGPPLSPKRNWEARRRELNKLRVFSGFVPLDQSRESEETTLGLVRPSKIAGLDITPVDSPDWTADELKKLVQRQQQGGLFDDEDAGAIRTLRKLPFAFHYRYECEVDGEVHTHRHKIADWEAGALFWNCRQQHGDNWEAPFREKLEQKLPAADLMFLMGTIHRFPDQWLIVSLVYPPREAFGSMKQTELAF